MAMKESRSLGDGVVGEQPNLQPGESFEYTSGTPLPTSSGIMAGFYIMEIRTERKSKLRSPFSLDSPMKVLQFTKFLLWVLRG